MNRNEILEAVKTAIAKDEEVYVVYCGGCCHLNGDTTETIEASLSNFWIVNIGDNTYFKDEESTEENWVIQ